MTNTNIEMRDAVAIARAFLDHRDTDPDVMLELLSTYPRQAHGLILCLASIVHQAVLRHEDLADMLEQMALDGARSGGGGS